MSIINLNKNSKNNDSNYILDEGMEKLYLIYKSKKLNQETIKVKSESGRTVIKGSSTLNRSEEHTSELQSLRHLVCRLLLENKKRDTFVSLFSQRMKWKNY